jgi:hypothetical protein
MSFPNEIRAVLVRIIADARERMNVEQEKSWGINRVLIKADADARLLPARTEVTAMLSQVHDLMARVNAQTDVNSDRWLVDLSAAIDLLGTAESVARQHLEESLSGHPEARDDERWQRTVRLNLCCKLVKTVVAEVTAAIDAMKTAMDVVARNANPTDVHSAETTVLAANDAQVCEAQSLHIEGAQSTAEVLALAQRALALGQTIQEKMAAAQTSSAGEPSPATAERTQWVRAFINQLERSQLSVERQAELVQTSMQLIAVLPRLDTVTADAWSKEAITWLTTFKIVVTQSVEARCQAESFQNGLFARA